MAINTTKIGVDITVDTSNIKSVYKGINQVQDQAESLIAEYQKLDSEISRTQMVISKGGNTEENIQKLEALRISFDGVYQSLTATTQQLTTLITTFKTLGGAEKILAETSLNPNSIKKQNERSAEIRNKQTTFAQNRGEVQRDVGIYVANQADALKHTKSVSDLFPPQVLKDAKEFYTLLGKIEERRKNLGKYIPLTDDEASRLPKENARRQTHEAIAQLKKNGKELESYDIQDIFEQFSIAPLIKRAQAQIKDSSFIQEGKGRLGIGGYNPFVEGQNFVPSSHKTSRGEIVPNSSLKVYHPLLSQFDLSGKSITQIEGAYNELIEKGDKESLKHAKVIQDAIVEAYKNTDSEFIKSKLEKRLYSISKNYGYEVDEGGFDFKYANDTTFYENLRPHFPKFSDPNYKKDFQIYDGLEYEHVDAETKEIQAVKDDLKKIQQERRATGEAVANFKNILNYFSNEDGSVNSEFAGYIKEILEAQSQNKNGIKNFKELISLILSNLKNSVYSEEGILPLATEGIKKEKIVKGTGKTASDIADEKAEGLDVKTETILNKEKSEELKQQAITLYDGAVVKLFETLTQIGTELNSTQQEILQPTLDMLSNIVTHTKKIDSKALVNALSNYATFGSVIADSISSFADQTDTDRKIAMTEAVNFMPVETEQKMLDSLNFRGQFQKAFSIPLSNARDFINKHNLNSSADKQVSDLATRIQSWSVDDFINDGLSELVSFVNNLPDIKDKDNTLMEALINNLRIVLAKKFFEIDNSDEKLRNLIKQVQELTIQGEDLNHLNSTDALDRFEFFIKQFYGETYNKGAYSINYNEEEAQKAKRSKTKRPQYSGSKGWEERSPKERFLGTTQALDVTARYGAGTIDEALKIIPVRIEEFESKRENEEKERQDLLGIVLNYETKLAEQTKIINEIAGKYYSKSSKSAIGGWKVDWKKTREEFTEVPQKQITEDQEKFKKAQKELSKLKNSQEEDEYLEAGQRLKQIGKSSRSQESFDKAIAIMKADAEYLRELRAYQEEESKIEEPQSQVQEKENEVVQQNIQQSQQLDQEIVQAQEKVNQSKEDIKQKLLSYAERYAKATSNAEKGKITKEISSIFGKGSDEAIYWKNKKNRNELVQEFSSLDSEEVIKVQQQEQQALEEMGKIAGEEHTKGIESATEAEKDKIVVSKELADVLSKEADAHEEVAKASEDEAKVQDKLNNAVDNGRTDGIRWDGKLDSIEGFIPEYDDKTYTYRKKLADGSYESVITATQGRDALYRGINPTFSEDLARIKKLAENTTGNNPLTAEMAGMNEKDFKFITEGVIASGLRGDLFHHLVDIMSKYNDAVQSLEDLEELAKQGDKQAQEDLRVYNDLKEDTISQLSRYGLGEDYLGINNRLASYMDAYNKAKDRYGISRTQFSEKQLGLTLKGSRGNINIGVTPDQVYSIIDEVTSGRNGAIFDSKTGNIKGYEALQLTTQLMALIANLDNEIDGVKVRDLIGDADLNKVKLFIADIGENYTEFIEYMRLTDEEVYNAFMNAREIIENGAKPLTHEESKYRLNRQLQGSRIIGSSGAGEMHQDEEFLRTPRDSANALKEYLDYYKKIADTKSKLDLLDKKIQEGYGTKKESEIESLQKERKEWEELLKLYEQHIPKTVDTKEGYIVGHTILTDDDYQRLLAKQSEIDAMKDVKTSENDSKISERELQKQNDYVEEYVRTRKKINDLLQEELELEIKINKEKDNATKDALTQQQNDVIKERERLEKTLTPLIDTKNMTFNSQGKVRGLTAANQRKIEESLYGDKVAYNRRETLKASNTASNSKELEKELNDKLYNAIKRRNDKLIDIEKKKTKIAGLDPEKDAETIEETTKEIDKLNEEVETLFNLMQKIKALGEDNGFSLGTELDENGIEVQQERFRALQEDFHQKELEQQNAQKQKTRERERKIGSGSGKSALDIKEKEYLNNLKEQGKLERDLARIEEQKKSYTGVQLQNAEKYANSLKIALNTLKGQLPHYDAQSKTLDGIAMTEEEINEFEEIRAKLVGKNDLELQKIQSSYKNEISLVDQLFASFKNILSNVSIYNVAQRIFNELERGFDQVIQSTKELDAAMVDIRIASGMRANQTRDFMLELNTLGDILGMTTQQMAEASNDWLRAGYVGREAAELTRASATLAQLGMISTSDATSYLISTLKGWKLEASEVMDVVSKLTAVDMSAAIGF